MIVLGENAISIGETERAVDPEMRWGIMGELRLFAALQATMFVISKDWKQYQSLWSEDANLGQVLVKRVYVKVWREKWLVRKMTGPNL
jgi:hypothetical protein